MTKRAWAIQAEPERPTFIGVGYFDWRLDRPGLSTMTFATRREARAALTDGRVRGAFPRARVVPVTVEARHAD